MWEDEEEEIDWAAVDELERSALEQAKQSSSAGLGSTAGPMQLPPVWLPGPAGESAPRAPAQPTGNTASSRPEAAPSARNAGMQPGQPTAPAVAPAVAALRRRIQEFQSIAPSLPPTKPKSSTCPGVYGRGCGGRLRWVCYGDPAWAHWGCGNWQNCDYREYPPPRKAAPGLSIQIDSPETIQVTALPGAEEAVVHCGGVEAVLRAAGVDLRRALPAPAAAVAQGPAAAAAQQGQAEAAKPPAAAAAEVPQDEGTQQLLPAAAPGVSAQAAAFGLGERAGGPSRQAWSLPSSPRHPCLQQEQKQRAALHAPLRLAHSLPASPARFQKQQQRAGQPARPLPQGDVAGNRPPRLARSPPASPAGSQQREQGMQLSCRQHHHHQQQQEVVGEALGAPQRLVHSLPASPSGLRHQQGGQLGRPPRSACSLPASPFTLRQQGGDGSTSSPAAHSLASALQQLRPLQVAQEREGVAEGGQAYHIGGHRQAQQQAQQQVANEGQQSAGQPGCMRFWLGEYERVRDALAAFRHQAGIQLLPSASAIPRPTLQAFRGQLFPRPTPAEVERRYRAVPSFLEAALMPFQREGVLFGLRRGGKCLLADEMGVGKTVQAIALASCYQEEWPLLIIAPASLRLVWAEELEKWLPQLRPSSIHVIEGKEGRVAPPLLPLITITSFEMMQRLTCEGCKQRGQAQPGSGMHSSRRCAGAQHCMASMGWRVVIVDESHQLRTSNRPPDAQHTEAVVSAVRLARRAVFLTGTPSLSRPYDLFRQVDALKPGLLGRDRFEFASAYCNRRAVPVPGGSGRLRFDNNGLSRPTELHVLLRREVMLRRLKREVLSQLPPKRRQVIRLPKPKAEHWPKRAAGGQRGGSRSDNESEGSGSEEDGEEVPAEEGAGLDAHVEPTKRSGSHMSAGHRTALAKLPSVIDWVMHALGARKRSGRGAQAEPGHGGEEDDSPGGLASDAGPKLLLFAHHRDVMDGLAAALDGASGFSAVPFVRIDGGIDGEGRREATGRFRADPRVRVALLSVTAAGVGLDFSCASAVVFAELPEDPSWVRQAEDRAHRKGQRLPVNVYFLCAKGTTDERRWQHLSRSLAKVTAVMDGQPEPEGGAAAAAGSLGEGASAAAAHGGLVVDEIADADVAGMTQAVPALLRQSRGPCRQSSSMGEGGGGVGRAGGVSLGGPRGAPQPPSRAMEAAATEGRAPSTENPANAAAAVPMGASPGQEPSGRRQQEQQQQPAAAAVSGAGVGAGGVPAPAGEAAAAAREGGSSQELELDSPPPKEPMEVWFEVSGNTSRVHFHLAPDGTRPLRLSLPMEALAGPHDSPLIEELLEAIGSGPSWVAAAGVAAPGPAPAAGMAAGRAAASSPGMAATAAGARAGEGAGGIVAGPGPVAAGVAQQGGGAALGAAVPSGLGGCCVPDAAAGMELNATAPPAAAPAQESREGSLGAAVASAVADAGRAGPSLGAFSSTFNSPAKAGEQPGSGGQAAREPTDGAAAAAAGGGRQPATVVSGIGPVAVDRELRRGALRSMIADARAFVAEWREIRAVQQARLAGRVLQAPLEQAVEALQKEAAASGAHGSSTSRFVDVQHRSDLPLPEGAGWRAVRVKFPWVVNEVVYQQPFLPSGARLCINCAAPVPGAESLPERATLQGMQLLFCSGACEARFALKCNGSAYRRALFKLERGRCVLCKLDCHDLVRRLQAIEKGTHRWGERRRVLVAQLAPRFLQHGHKKQLEQLVKSAVEGNAWHADHIRAVYQGGGLCDVENLRTLCVLCHLDVTKRQAKERGLERRAKADLARQEGADGSSPKRLRRRARIQRIFSDTDSPAVQQAGPGAVAAAEAAAAEASATAQPANGCPVGDLFPSGAAPAAAAAEDGDSGAEPSGNPFAGYEHAADDAAGPQKTPQQQRALKRAREKDSKLGTAGGTGGPGSAEPRLLRRRPRLNSILVIDAEDEGAWPASRSSSASGAAAQSQAGAGRAEGKEASPPAKRQALQRRVRQAAVYIDSPS